VVTLGGSLSRGGIGKNVNEICAGLEKLNSYHDARGRFASGDGADSAQIS
jgi:hypothetical protein